MKLVTNPANVVTNHAMAKPPSSNRSIRLPDELWATIQADADARGESVNAVVGRHLRIAYSPKDKVTVQRIVDETMVSSRGARATARVKAADDKLRMPRAPVGSRLKGAKK